MRPTPLALISPAAAGGALVTLLVSLLPFVSFAYRSGSAHIAIETAAALIALLTAYLVFGRFRESRELRDLALVFSLALFAGTNLFLSVVPALASRGEAEGFATWAP